MKVLVLGGSGWLGHHIAKQFHAAGAEVTVASRGVKSAFLEDIAELAQVRIDKKSDDAMRELLKEEFDVIVDSVPGPETVQSVARHAKHLKRYLHCSSTGGYAPLPFLPCDETAPYTGFPVGGGWKTKVEVDRLAMRLFMEQGFPATVIRPCYITGPGALPLDNLGGRRADFLDDLAAGRAIDLPDNGLALLQPIHVEDLAAAFVCAASCHQAAGQIYNICCDNALTIADYVRLNAAAVGGEANLRFVELETMLQKYAGVCSEIGLRFFATHMCFTNAKARTQLGWRPRYSTVAAVEETARWAVKRQR